MHLGYRRGGWPGLAVAGAAFALPAAVIVFILAWAYARWGTVPEATAVLAGLAPVVVAIVAHATVMLGRSVLSSPLLAAIAGAAVVASIATVPDVATLVAGGVVSLAADPVARRVAAKGRPLLHALAMPGIAAAALPMAGQIGLGGLFLSFLKIGTVLFGSGYLLIALLRAEFVVGSGVLTERQLLDAVAVGQITPGPVFTTATFVGYVLLGVPGAVVATLGMALPAVTFVALSVPVLDRLRASHLARTALAGVAAAVVGLLAAVTAALARTAIVDPITAALGIAAFGLLAAGRLGPAWLLLAGAVVGALRDAVALG